jgi:nucleoside-diphosphate-sugar epimerase
VGFQLRDLARDLDGIGPGHRPMAREARQGSPFDLGRYRSTLEAVAERIADFLTLEVLARVLADVVIVNACYLVALTLGLLSAAGTDGQPSEQLALAFEVYVSHSVLLTLLAVSMYAASGVYSRGRSYGRRHKAAVIAQAVSLAYLSFGFVQYIGMAKDWLTATPWMAMFLGWGLTLGTSLGARMWASLWAIVVHREEPPRPESNRKGPIRNVLVIGGAGFIGSTLCRQLIAQGYSVRVLDALLYGKESLAELEGHPRFELMHGDSREVSSVFAAMLGADAVVHLGELVGDPACALNEQLTLEINLAATRMLAEAAKGYGIKRLIYASSCSVYGASDQVLDENSRVRPASLYAKAKVASERALAELAGDHFGAVTLRLGTVFGLSHRPRFDLVANLFTAQAVSGSEITVFGAHQWRPFVHVKDVARAIVRCLQAPAACVNGRTFNVGTDSQNHTLGDLARIVVSEIPEAKQIRRDPVQDPRNYRVSFAKIRRELGFECTVGLEEGTRELAEALRTGIVSDYTSAQYSNHKTLSDPDAQLQLRIQQVSDWVLSIDGETEEGEGAGFPIRAHGAALPGA